MGLTDRVGVTGIDPSTMDGWSQLALGNVINAVCTSLDAGPQEGIFPDFIEASITYGDVRALIRVDFEHVEEEP